MEVFYAMFSLLAFGFGLFLGQGFESDDWKSETVERGHAIYCPLDGEWAWKGECND